MTQEGNVEMLGDLRAEHHTRRVNGVKLHSVVGGHGPVVVLLHGWPETWHTWREVMPVLARSHTVLAPDLRGMGDSEKAYDGYDKKTAANDIAELLRALGAERVSVVGHDIGGMVAYALAAQHPELVERLAILEVLLPGFGFEQELQTTEERPLWHPAFHAASDIAEALVRGRERLYLSNFFGLAVYNPAAIGEEDLDVYTRALERPGALRASFAYYRAVFQDARDNQALARTKLVMPVLAVGGEQSMGERVADSLRQVARDVQGVVIPACGHWLSEERPAELGERLTAFLAGR